MKNEDFLAQKNAQVEALPRQEDGDVIQSTDVALTKKGLKLKLVNDHRTVQVCTTKSLAQLQQEQEVSTLDYNY